MLRLVLIWKIVINPIFALANDMSFLDIHSSKLVFDRQNKKAIFTGNVVMHFKEITLITDQVIFLFLDNNKSKIKEIIFPEKIKAIKKSGNDESIIISDHANYRMLEEKLTLKGNVILSDKDGIVSGNEVLYYGKLKNVMLDA
jgi:lipopolysaccharide export system protein LptA